MRRFLAAAALGVVAMGCERAPAPPTAAPVTVGSLTVRLRAEGDALMAQHEYEKAAVKYQTALNEEPGDVSIRYAFAVALSYLPARRDEAVEAFRIVMRNGRPGAAEVTAAREWLASAGELGEGEVAAALPPPAADPTPKGRVFGNIRWQDVEPRSRMVRVNISLTGDDIQTRDAKFGREFKIGQVFEFRDVPPGAYQLVAAVAGTTMWEIKVDVAPDKDTLLDLTEGNAVVAKDYSPPSD